VSPVYEGFLQFGETEIINDSRAVGYMQSGDCSVSWLNHPACEGIQQIDNEGRPYDIENIEDAPWYDPRDETTARFLGVHGLKMENLPGSTREGKAQEAITPGGVVGRVRNTTRRVRVEAVLSARGEDALEAGFSWLDAALRPLRCTQLHSHEGSCTGSANAMFFTSCPPLRREFTSPEVFWNTPLTNLVTNPSFEAATGTAFAMRTNIAPNPAFETTTAFPVPLRYNLAINPGFEVDTAGWSGGSATIARSTVDKHDGTASVLVTTAAASSTTGDLRLSSGSATVFPTGILAGKTYTISAWVNMPIALASPSNAATSRQNRILCWYSIDGSTLVPVFGTQGTNTVGWQRISTTFTIPSNATGALIGIGCAGSATDPAFQTYVDSVLIEESLTLGTYFDGSTGVQGDYYHLWQGTAHASASSQNGAEPANVTAPPGTQALRYSTLSAPHSGTRSLRFVLTAGSPTAIGFPVTSASVTNGATYTMMGVVRPMTRTQIFTPRIGNTNGTPFTAPVGVWTPFRTTVLTTSTSSGATGLLIPGAGSSHAVGDIIDIDQVLIVDGTYTGPYFDGATVAKERRNVAPNPQLATASTGWAVSGGTGSRVAVTDLPGFSWAYQQTQSAVPTTRRLYADLTNRVTPGFTYAVSVWVRVTQAGGGSWELRAGDSTGMDPALATAIVIGDGTWRLMTLTFTATTANVFIGLRRTTAGSGSETFGLTGLLVEEGKTVPGEFFDGATTVGVLTAAWEGTANNSPSYLYSPDSTYAWTGTAHASTSTQTVTLVAGLNGTNGIQGTLSTQWSSDRAKSLRMIVTDTTSSDRYRYFTLSTIASGQSVTVNMVTHVDTPTTLSGAVTLSEASGALRNLVIIPASTALSGTQQWSTTVTIPADWVASKRLIFRGSTVAGVDVWYDSVLVVAGAYDGPYFDGAFPDSTVAEMEVPGAFVGTYEWTGTADASTSVATTGSVIAIEDEGKWQAAVDKVVRYMHTTTCVAGPTVVEKFHRGDAWGYVVEFVLVSAVPWLFGTTMILDKPPGFTDVIQDVPFNLVPYPSAELESGTVVASTNFVTNPSAETNVTNWVVVADGTKILPAQVGISQGVTPTDPASVGTKSVKALFTANTTNTAGYFGTQQTVALPGHTSTTRYSVNLWATASIQSGTAVLGTIEYVVFWLNASDVVLGSVFFGSGPATGGAKSVDKLLPTAGTVKAVIEARLNVTSWSSGALIRLYADAAAITTP